MYATKTEAADGLGTRLLCSSAGIDLCRCSEGSAAAETQAANKVVCVEMRDRLKAVNTDQVVSSGHKRQSAIS